MNRIVLLVALIAAAACVLILATRRPETQQAAVTPTADGFSSAEARSSLALAGDLERAAVEQALEENASRSVRCIDASDGSPVAGIRVYAIEQVVAGPSGADGLVTLGVTPRKQLTFWGETWIPVSIRGGVELPETVRLERASAVLELAFENLVPGQRVVRTLLQPRDRHATGTAPWDPELKEWALGLWGARDLPAGEYDLYAWVDDPGAGIKPLSAPRTLLSAGSSTIVRMDASTPAPVEEDH